MALDSETSFVNTDGASFPDNAAQNDSTGSAGDGTEFVKLMIDNYMFGRQQALLNYASLTPNGIKEQDGNSQELEALIKGFGIGPGIGVTYWKNNDPATNGDRVLLLQGQGVLIANYGDLDDACYVGDTDNATVSAAGGGFYHASDSAGTTPDTAGPYLILPDARGLSLKNIGDATVNARTKTGPVYLGEMQEDQGQGHIHEETYYEVGGTSQFQTTVSNPTGYPGTIFTDVPSTDGTNGTPRTGLNTRDSSLGTNFGITY